MIPEAFMDDTTKPDDDAAAEQEGDDAPEPALAKSGGVCPVKVAVALLLAALFVNLWTLGDSPLARTEGHRALTGHEIVETGNWITPTLYGKVYLRKPPGHYWVIAITEMIAGHGDEFVWRLPSALSAVALVMLMWWMGRRWFGEVGGAAAGFSCLGMVALWSQNRAAEIDALNTLVSVGCACAVLECGFGPTKRRWAWGIAIALSTAAVLLVKGPAGLPVMGGTFIGASIATQRWAWAKRPSVWLSVIIGILIFAAWGVAAAMTVAADDLNVDTSGPNEVFNRLSPENLGHVLDAAALPFLLIGYAMPWSIVVLLGLFPSVTRSITDHTMRVRTRAAIGAVIASMALCGMVLMTRPRYGYITLPLVSLVVGAFGEAWFRGYFGARMRTSLRQIMTLVALMLAGLSGTLTWLAWRDGSPHHAWLIGGAAAAGVATLVAVGSWIMQKHRPGTWAIAGLIVASSIAFNDYKHLDREERSGQQLGLQLREEIGPNEAIVAEKTVLDHPEVFYYGKLDVKRYRGGLAEAFQRDAPACFILHELEWEEWQPKLGTRVARVVKLDDTIGKWLMVWYLGKPSTIETR